MEQLENLGIDIKPYKKHLSSLLAQAQESDLKNRFRGQETVNGIFISVAWIPNDRGYEILIDQEEEEGKSGISNLQSTITLGDDKEMAKEVFDFAVTEAKKTKDTGELNKKVDDFVQSKKKKR